MLNVKQGSCEYQVLKSFGLTRSGIETRYTDYEANATTTHRLNNETAMFQLQCVKIMIDKVTAKYIAGSMTQFFMDIVMAGLRHGALPLATILICIKCLEVRNSALSLQKIGFL